MERGSLTIELAIILTIILIVIGMVVIRFGKAFERVVNQTVDPAVYQEAFWEKIQKIRIEKVMKEKR